MMSLIEEAIFDYTGLTLVKRHIRGYWETGYIDHQSLDTLDGVITDKQSIIDLVFNDKNIIIIDNDNH